MKRKILVCAFLLILAIPAHSQWVSMKGPIGFTVYSLFASGDTILAQTNFGTEFGLFRSTDGGLHWVKNDSLKSTLFYTFAQCGDILYAGGDDGLYFSSDFGATWDTVTGMSQSFGWSPLAVMGQNIFIGNGNLYRFVGTGTNWSSTPFPVQEPAFYHTGCIGVMGKDLFLCTANNENDTDGMFRSTDSGVTLDSLPVFHETVTAIYPMGGELFAAADSSIYVSKDTGTSWSRVSSIPNGLYVESFWGIGPHIFAGLSDGSLIRSDDSCRNWNYANSGMNVQNISALVQSGKGIFAGTSDGLFASTNFGETWAAWDNGFENFIMPAYALTTVDSQVFAGSKNEVFECNGNNSNWSTVLRVSVLSNVSGIAALAANGSRLFARTVDDIWISSNNGKTWPDTETTKSDFDQCGFYSKGPLILSSSSNGVIRSTDNGNTWDTTFGLSGTPSCGFTAIGSNIFAAVYGGIAVSTDDGASWNMIDSEFQSLWVNGIASMGPILFANQPGTEPEDGFSRSLDSGVTWKRIDSSIFPRGVMTALVVRNQIFASPQVGSLYVSNDSGISWQRTDLDLHIYSLATDGNQLYAGTGSGVWRRPLSEMTPSSFALGVKGTVNDTISFGNIPVGNSSLRIVTPYNAGIEPVTIQPIPQPGNNFSTSDLSTTETLDSGESFTFEVFFQPIDTGYHSAKLSFLSEAKEVTIVLTGTGYIASGVNDDLSPEFEFFAHPNPVSSSTTISFVPQSAGYADISILNQLGTEVAHLYSGELLSGEHTFTWEPTSMPDGVYECVVRMNGSAQTVPLLLQR